MNQKKFKLNLKVQKPDLQEILRGDKTELQEIHQSLVFLGRALFRWHQLKKDN